MADGNVLSGTTLVNWPASGDNDAFGIDTTVNTGQAQKIPY